MREHDAEFNAEILVYGVSDELFDSSFFIDAMMQCFGGSQFKICSGPRGAVSILVVSHHDHVPEGIASYLRTLLAVREPAAAVEVVASGANFPASASPSSDDSPPTASLPATDREKLLAYDRVCRVLWPAVRHFGLLGAHPEYVEAVVELAGLLGIGSPVARNPQVIEAAARADGVAAVSEWIRDSKQLKEMIGGRMCERVAELVSRVRVDG